MFKNSEQRTAGGLRIVSLSVENKEEIKEIWVLPSMGMNLCRFSINGKNVIDFDETYANGSFFGTPLLYPTPNRVRGGIFMYKGSEYPQIKRGKRVMIHGLVRDEAFSDVTIGQDEKKIWVEGSIDFNPSTAVFEAFPFMHRFTVRYFLDENGITFEYEINNYGNQSIPYGIALHPYFRRIDGDESTLIHVPFNKIFKNIGDTLLPTGRLYRAAGKKDISKLTRLGDIDVDAVYTDNPEKAPAKIVYKKSGFNIMLTCSPEFKNMVVYAQAEKKFFCLENQSCSTDAHNMHYKGFVNEAGIEFAEVGRITSGFIRFRVEKASI